MVGFFDAVIAQAQHAISATLGATENAPTDLLQDTPGPPRGDFLDSHFNAPRTDMFLGEGDYMGGGFRGGFGGFGGPASMPPLTDFMRFGNTPFSMPTFDLGARQPIGGTPWQQDAVRRPPTHTPATATTPANFNPGYANPGYAAPGAAPGTPPTQGAAYAGPAIDPRLRDGMNEDEAYIRQAAAVRGIDPDIAVAVANTEGGANPGGRARQNMQGAPAYGHFQLYIGGPQNGAMGDEALAAGIDPRDPAQWQKAIDFALDRARERGWQPFQGWAAAGRGDWEGINTNPQGPPDMTPRRPVGPGGIPVAGRGEAIVPGQYSGGNSPGFGPQADGSMPPAPTDAVQNYGEPAQRAMSYTNGKKYRIQFGFRQTYTNPSMAQYGDHKGVDLVLDDGGNGRGSLVPSMEGGTVIYRGTDPNGGLGIAIRDAKGYDHWYFHLDDSPLQVGQQVGHADAVGKLGASGIDPNNPADGGPHLHYEVRIQGTKNVVDPTPWLKALGLI